MCLEKKRVDGIRRFRIRLGALVAGGCLALLVVVSTPGDEPPPRFDPAEMGRLESAMWRSYYEGRWLDLAAQTLDMAAGQFGMSPPAAARAAWHAARAARFFRGDSHDPRSLPELERYYAVVRAHLGGEFDVAEAAGLELLWWRERRQSIPPQDYARTIGDLTALVYGLPAETIYPAARLRAEAMAYRDARRDGAMTDEDWLEIANQLTRAYQLLSKALRIEPEDR